jgi:hypothetical protein
MQNPPPWKNMITGGEEEEEAGWEAEAEDDADAGGGR